MRPSFTGSVYFSAWMIGQLVFSTLNAHAQMVLAPPAAKMVAEAKQQVTMIDMAGLKAAVIAKDAGLLLDVRLPSEQAASGRVLGSLSMPRGTVEFAIWPKVGFPRQDGSRAEDHGVLRHELAQCRRGQVAQGLGFHECSRRRHAHGGLAGRWIPGREVDAIAAVALSAEASTGFSESMLLQG